ncbi:hypothetical protein [Spiroplasma endosymbiont of Ammophila pubescens]|uniref:hypothetical protein n=1 Tax=Spiroplasma endosymbiont of Ammophila pubescens TaxID=3066315 RepID=UPI0032B13AE7
MKKFLVFLGINSFFPNITCGITGITEYNNLKQNSSLVNNSTMRIQTKQPVIAFQNEIKVYQITTDVLPNEEKFDIIIKTKPNLWKEIKNLWETANNSSFTNENDKKNKFIHDVKTKLLDSMTIDSSIETESFLLMLVNQIWSGWDLINDFWVEYFQENYRMFMHFTLKYEPTNIERYSNIEVKLCSIYSDHKS